MQVLNLSSLIEIAVAFGVAYLSLPAFRYEEKAEQFFNRFVVTASEVFKQASTNEERKIEKDTVITEVEKERKKYNSCNGKWSCKKIYGRFDRAAIFITTGVNISVLIWASYNSIEVQGWWSYILLLIPIIGIVSPSALIWTGNSMIRKLELYLQEKESLLRETYDVYDEDLVEKSHKVS